MEMLSRIPFKHRSIVHKELHIMKLKKEGSSMNKALRIHAGSVEEPHPPRVDVDNLP